MDYTKYILIAIIFILACIVIFKRGAMKAFYIDKEGYTIGIHVSTWKEESMWYHRVLSIFYPSIKKRFFRLKPMEVESKETSPGVYDLTIPNQPKGTEIIIEKQ